MPECKILVGLPGVGKSTFIDKNYPYHNVLSTDDIVSDIAENYGVTYDYCWADSIKLATKLMWDEAKRIVDNNWKVVIDRTNLNPKARKQFIDYFKRNGYDVSAIVFDKPADDEWKIRLIRPGKTIPRDVLISMQQSYVEPTHWEGFTKIEYVNSSGEIYKTTSATDYLVGASNVYGW